MKTNHFVLLISALALTVSIAAHADDFLKLPRDERCKSAGGVVAGHGLPDVDATTKTQGTLGGPIDCTCGGRRFNPIREGDACRDGKILSAFDRYCQDSKGTVSIIKINAKPFPIENKRCKCGNAEFTPTKSTACFNGQVTQKN